MTDGQALRLRSAWARNVLFPVESWMRRIPLSKYFREYSSAQWWSRERLDHYRARRLSQLLHHSYATVPYYRKMMDAAGVVPNDIRTPSDLTRLPVLTRNDLYESGEQLVSVAFDSSRLRKGSSSGSTGSVVTYYATRQSLGAGFAAERVGWSMAGYPFGARRCVVWGNPIAAKEQWTKLGSRLKQAAYGERRIAAYELSDQDHVTHALRVLDEFRPDYLWGYPNAIYFLATKAREAGLTGLSCSGVLTTAETVHEHMRETIGEVFGPVYDGYGCGEMSGVAQQCTEGTYHLIEPHVIVEYGDVEREGARELILTDLENYGMPLIRYQVGDLAIPSEVECRCGRTWGTFTGLAGRTADLITTRGGGALLVPSFFGSAALTKLPRFRRYQVAKISPDLIEVRIESDGPLETADLADLDQQLSSYLAGRIDFRVVQVDGIDRTAGGKYRLVVDETVAESSRYGRYRDGSEAVHPSCRDSAGAPDSEA